jgi:hypothetical protein
MEARCLFKMTVNGDPARSPVIALVELTQGIKWIGDKLSLFVARRILNGLHEYWVVKKEVEKSIDPTVISPPLDSRWSSFRQREDLGV